jgi:hypothetical protein
MKNIFIFTALLMLVTSTSFAAGTVSGAFATFTDANTGKALHAAGTAAGVSTTSALIGKNSTGVSVAWQTATGGYALATQHRSGTKAYGTSFDSTAIFQTITDVAPGTPAIGNGALSATDTTDFADTDVWKAM